MDLNQATYKGPTVTGERKPQNVEERRPVEIRCYGLTCLVVPHREINI